VTFDKQIGFRLRAFISHLNITQQAFAQRLAITKGYLNDVVNGRKGIGVEIIINTAKEYPELNLRWLITGEGFMLELEKMYVLPPDELPSGVEEGVKIEYLKREGELERIKRLLNEHEQRLRDLEIKG